MAATWPKRKPSVLAAVNVLADVFTNVSADMPARRPDVFVRVSRIGGRQPNPATDHGRILIECFATDTDTVEDMCATASQALHNAVGTFVTTSRGDVFVRSWDNEQGPIELPHPQVLDRERWQFHGDLLVKAN